MNGDAERWVVIAAVLVAGIYAYRRLVEPVTTGASLKQLAGIGNPVPLGAFVTAWGFTFLVVAVIATADAGLGKAFAMLIATADLLANAQPIASDVTSKLKGSPNVTPVSTSTAPAASVSAPGSASTPNMFQDPFSGFPLVTNPTTSTVGGGVQVAGSPGVSF